MKEKQLFDFFFNKFKLNLNWKCGCGVRPLQNQGAHTLRAVVNLGVRCACDQKNGRNSSLDKNVPVVTQNYVDFDQTKEWCINRKMKLTSFIRSNTQSWIHESWIYSRSTISQNLVFMICLRNIYFCLRIKIDKKPDRTVCFLIKKVNLINIIISVQKTGSVISRFDV